MEILSFIVMGIGMVFMLIGMIGLFKPKKDFYFRILISCKIDTVGMLTFLIGLGIRHGFSFFTGKLFLIALILLFLNPMVAHIVSRAAYRSGCYMREDTPPAKEDSAS